MAYAKVQTAINAYGTDLSDSTQTVTLGATATAGNLLVAVMRLASDETTVVNDPSGFTLARSFTHSDVGLNARIFVWWKIAAGSETGVTFTTGSNTSQNVELAVGEFSGNAASSPFDTYAENLATGGTSTHASGNLLATTSTADALLVAVAQVDGGARSFTKDAAYLDWDAAGSGFQGAISYRIITVATNTGATFTSSGATDAVVGVVAFKGAAGGGGRTTKNTRSHPLGVRNGMGWRKAA
jgi:hypothetical protein